MRIGEIAIVGPDRLIIDTFIRTVSDEIEIQNDTLTFARFRVNEQLLLHLYGLEYADENLKPAWDLMSKKLMGYVFVFNWTAADSISDLRPAIDALTARYKIPFVAAAATGSEDSGIPEKLIDLNMHLSGQARFTFYNPGDQSSVRNVLLILVNALLDRITQ